VGKILVSRDEARYLCTPTEKSVTPWRMNISGCLLGIAGVGDVRDRAEPRLADRPPHIPPDRGLTLQSDVTSLNRGQKFDDTFQGVSREVPCS